MSSTTKSPLRKIAARIGPVSAPRQERQAPTRRWQRGRRGGTDRAPVQSTRAGGAAVPVTKPRCLRAESRSSGPSGSVPRPVQAERRLPGLLRSNLLSPRAHERGGPRVACVALERITLEKGPSATDTDRLLGDRDYRALHRDV